MRELLDLGVAQLRESGSETARLDAELLLAHALDAERTSVIAHWEAPVGDGAAARFMELLGRRVAGEPVAYIRGVKEFHGLAFAVDPRALIPRPETERLVELAELEIVRRLIGAPRPKGSPPITVIDVGTGSGAIVVSVASLLRKRKMADEVVLTAVDVNADALQLARENAVAHAVGDRIEFETADLLPGDRSRRWDVVLANLPYVRTDVIPTLPRATSFEPRLALDGGDDGLRVIGRLLDQLPHGLADGGAALLEIGGDQEAGMRALAAERLPAWSCDIERDLSGLPRVAVLRR
ncbi:MAG TPA: peptide chain release factor N(5)-glutamine methyltransferase [Candidatus Limnocylindria bacterium]|nr:peptide chain release factor N(5)-glutamine methyltransferase [Candidatus Limnocylindria bacterium]